MVSTYCNGWECVCGSARHNKTRRGARANVGRHADADMAPAPLLLTRDGSSFCEISASRLRIFGGANGALLRDLLSPVARRALVHETSVASIHTKCLVVRADGKGGATYECLGATILSSGFLRVRSHGLTISQDLSRAASIHGPVRVRWSIPLTARTASPPASSPARAFAGAVRWMRDASSPARRRFASDRWLQQGRIAAPLQDLHGAQYEQGDFAGAVVASSCALDLVNGALTFRGANGWTSVTITNGGSARKDRGHRVTLLSADSLQVSQGAGAPLSLRSDVARTRTVSQASPFALKFGEAACWRFPVLASALGVPAVMGGRRPTAPLQMSSAAAAARPPHSRPANKAASAARPTPPRPPKAPAPPVDSRLANRNPDRSAQTAKPRKAPPQGRAVPPAPAGGSRPTAWQDRPPPPAKRPPPPVLPVLASPRTRTILDRASVWFGAGRDGGRRVALRIPVEVTEAVRAQAGMARAGVRASGVCTILTTGRRSAAAGPILNAAGGSVSPDWAGGGYEEEGVEALDSSLGLGGALVGGLGSAGPQTSVELTGKMVARRASVRLAGGFRFSGSPIARVEAVGGAAGRTPLPPPAPPPALQGYARARAAALESQPSPPAASDTAAQRAAAEMMFGGRSGPRPPVRPATQSFRPPASREAGGVRARPRPAEDGPDPGAVLGVGGRVPPPPPPPAGSRSPSATSTTLEPPAAVSIPAPAASHAPIVALPFRASLSLPAGADRRLTLRCSRGAVSSLRSELKARLAVRQLRSLIPPLGLFGDPSSLPSAGAGWKLSVIGGAALSLTRRGGQRPYGTEGGGKAGESIVPTDAAAGASRGVEPAIASTAALEGPATARQQDAPLVDMSTDTTTVTSSLNADDPAVSTGQPPEPARGLGEQLTRLEASNPQSVAQAKQPGAGVLGSTELSAALRLTRIPDPLTEPSPPGGRLSRRSIRLPPLSELTLALRLRAPLTRAQQHTPELIFDQGAKFGDAAALRVRASLPLGATQSSGSRAPSVRAAVSLAL
jgi:hypothetical protein